MLTNSQKNKNLIIYSLNHFHMQSVSNENSHVDIPYTNSLFVCNLQKIIVLLQYKYSYNKNNKINIGYSYHFQDQLLQKIVDYIYSSAYEPITIYEICKKFCVSRSSLQLLFKNNLNISPKNFMIQYKMKKSKELILENKYTISEILVCIPSNRQLKKYKTFVLFNIN